MQFESPWWLIALAGVMPFLVWLHHRSYAQLAPVARWGSLGLRAAILVLLMVAISRPSVQRRSDAHHVVFALDVSRSISRDNLDAAIADIERLAREAHAAHRNARVSIIAFGQEPERIVQSDPNWKEWSDPLRDKLRYATVLPELYARRTKLISGASESDRQALEKLQGQIGEVERFRDRVAGECTDVERALRLGLNVAAPNETSEVYLFTDANINRGSDSAFDGRSGQGLQLRTPIHAVLLDRPLPPEVAIADVVAPSSVRVNQGFDVDIRVASTVETGAQLVFYKDGYAVYDTAVALHPGENAFKVPSQFVSQKGFHALEATIRPRIDTQLENNTLRQLVLAPGEARVLYVDSDEDQMPYLKNALELEGISVEARPAGGVPQALSELLSFDAIILSNVPADRLSYRQMQMIRTYVQEFGGGFMMLGGNESFGLGGYYNTPIEEILPVRMPIQKEMNRPSLAIMLVIDKSGSMAGAKIELAKRAAIATSEAINPRDLIGVIGFDSADRVLLELTPAADRQTINDAIATLDAGGGTFLYPALESAHNNLAQSNAQRKHVIVLSDGQTQGYGYEEKVQAMSTDGITLSSVGIGEGADMKLMESIAVAGGGRAYFTNDFYSIPQIFTREALRASNSMLVERLVEPATVGDDTCLRDIPAEELPLLSGYVATTPKAAASLILASDNGDPLLAKWRYGLGRTAAFTSESKPRWAEDWIQWPDFAKFWSQLVRSIIGQDLGQTVSVHCSHQVDGDSIRLAADISDAAGSFLTDADVELTTLDDSGAVRKLAVERNGPGLFESKIPVRAAHRDRHFVWRVKSSGEETPPVSYGFADVYAPEFRTLGPNREAADRIANQNGGRLASVGASRLEPMTGGAAHRSPIWQSLLIAALLLVPIDILVRRVG